MFCFVSGEFFVFQILVMCDWGWRRGESGFNPLVLSFIMRVNLLLIMFLVTAKNCVLGGYGFESTAVFNRLFHYCKDLWLNFQHCVNFILVMWESLGPAPWEKILRLWHLWLVGKRGGLSCRYPRAGKAWNISSWIQGVEDLKLNNYKPPSQIFGITV